MLEKYIEELTDVLINAVAGSMFPPGFTTPQEAIDELKANIAFHVAVLFAYMQENPNVANPPFDLENEVTSLVDFYMEAYLETNSPEDEPLTEEEILNQKEDFAVWVRAFLTYANTASEGVMWPPYTYPRPSPQNQIHRLAEFIDGLSDALSSALIAATFPPIFPASAQDRATITAFYRAFVEAALTYAHNNPGVASPPYG